MTNRHRLSNEVHALCLVCHRWRRLAARSLQAIVMYHMKHNSEPEAVDLLLEVDSIGVLLDHIDSDNYQRTCLYLTSTAAYLSEPDDHEVFTAAFDAYMKVRFPCQGWVTSCTVQRCCCFAVHHCCSEQTCRLFDALRAPASLQHVHTRTAG